MSDKVLIVTGAFGALGSALVDAALHCGWRVAAVDHASARRGGGPEGVFDVAGVDLSDAAQADAAAAAVVERYGRVDGLANVAGGFEWRTVAEAEPALWERLWRMNVLTAANACRAALPHLERSGGGRIVNVGANGAVKAAAGMGPYAATKAGVHRLTEALGEEWKGRVAVNAVLPSILDTPQNRADMPDADASTWVTPEAIAKVMLFLLSEDAAPVTGALIPVTGGV